MKSKLVKAALLTSVITLSASVHASSGGKQNPPQAQSFSLFGITWVISK